MREEQVSGGQRQAAHLPGIKWDREGLQPSLPLSLSRSARWKRSALSALLGIFSHHINIYLLLCWSWHRQEEGDGARSPRGCRCSGKLHQGWFVWREEGLDWRKATGIIPDRCLLLEEILLVYSLKISTFPAAICSVTSVYPHPFTNFTLTVAMWVFTDILGKQRQKTPLSIILWFYYSCQYWDDL